MKKQICNTKEDQEKQFLVDLIQDPTRATLLARTVNHNDLSEHINDLTAQGLLTDLDQPSFKILNDCWRRLQSIAPDDHKTFVSLTKQWLALCRQFGMTPKSRNQYPMKNASGEFKL